MEKVEEVPTLELGKIGYEAYRESTGGISLASFHPIPAWPDVEKSIQGSWNAAGSAIGMAIIDELKRTAEKAGGKAIVRLAGNFSALVEAEDPEPEHKQHPTPEQVITPVQKPSIGRIVIYHYPQESLAEIMRHDCPAIITAVNECGSVDLYVMSPHATGGYQRPSADFGTKEGQWSWPERVA